LRGVAVGIEKAKKRTHTGDPAYFFAGKRCNVRGCKFVHVPYEYHCVADTTNKRVYCGQHARNLGLVPMNQWSGTWRKLNKMQQETQLKWLKDWTILWQANTKVKTPSNSKEGSLNSSKIGAVTKATEKKTASNNNNQTKVVAADEQLDLPRIDACVKHYTKQIFENVIEIQNDVKEIKRLLENREPDPVQSKKQKQTHVDEDKIDKGHAELPPDNIASAQVAPEPVNVAPAPETNVEQPQSYTGSLFRSFKRVISPFTSPTKKMSRATPPSSPERRSSVDDAKLKEAAKQVVESANPAEKSDLNLSITI